MRTEPEKLTIAYMAKGAGVVLQEDDVPSDVIDSYSGEIGLMESLIYPALLVDRVADYFDNHDGHPGVFQYEVSEEFGAAYMRALIGGADASAAPEILRQIMLGAGYGEEALGKAFADAAAEELGFYWKEAECTKCASKIAVALHDGEPLCAACFCATEPLA